MSLVFEVRYRRTYQHRPYESLTIEMASTVPDNAQLADVCHALRSHVHDELYKQLDAEDCDIWNPLHPASARPTAPKPAATNEHAYDHIEY